jgi:hypothetical protein
MAIWRMAFRDGTGGQSFWADCKQRGVAAIAYQAIGNVDLSQPPGRHTPGWSQLAPPEKGCMKHFVTDMAVGDVIYAKEGRDIVGRGVITSPYRFESENPIVLPGGRFAYRHQRRIDWFREFGPVRISVGHPAITTVIGLKPADAEAIERVEEHANGYGRTTR